MRHTNYDEIAATYDRRYVEEDYRGIERALLDFVAGTQIAAAEVGCGTGHFFSINAHHHFSDKRRFFQEACRVLRPSGSIMTIALDPHTGIDQWWVYDYFDGTLDIDRQRYPSCDQLRAWMRDAGLSNVDTREVQHLPGDVTARDALQKGIVSPDHTSQLAVLTREEFETGIARIRSALHENEAVRLTADLRVYATYGTVA